MSRVVFHSPTATAAISGKEHTYALSFCQDLLCVALHLHDPLYHGAEPYSLRAVLPPDTSQSIHQVREEAFLKQLSGYIASDKSMFINPMTGEAFSAFSVALNTALVTGSDVVKWLARLAGQSELHTYVEGKHRLWLAAILEQGVEHGLLRLKQSQLQEGRGWQDVITLLRENAVEPIVTSFDVSNTFPDMNTALEGKTWTPPRLSVRELQKRYGWEDVEEMQEQATSDAWEALSEAEQWYLAFTGLQLLNAGQPVELSPNTWNTFFFENGVTGFHLWHFCQEMKNKRVQS